MAKSAAKREFDQQSAKGGLIGGLLMLLLVTAVAGGVGFLAGGRAQAECGWIGFPPGNLCPRLRSKRRPAWKILQLPTIVTNLAGQTGGWVRLEASVLIGDEKAVAPGIAAQFAEDVTALLRTLSLSQISGAAGFQHLREDLVDRLRLRSGGRVREFIIQSMVIE